MKAAIPHVQMVRVATKMISTGVMHVYVLGKSIVKKRVSYSMNMHTSPGPTGVTVIASDGNVDNTVFVVTSNGAFPYPAAVFAKPNAAHEADHRRVVWSL